jgi:hypothetical protein
MSLNPRSKQWYETSARYNTSSHRVSGRNCEDEEEHMRIPAVIIVPRRPHRVTSTMEQLYREMPGASNPGGDGDSSKPWQVDMARKSYSRDRRHRRSKCAHPPVPATMPTAPESPPPPVGMVSFTRELSLCMDQGPPELDGSWAKGSHNDSGYPSDEEGGFTGHSSSGSINNSYTSPMGMQQSRPVRSHMYYFRRS